MARPTKQGLDYFPLDLDFFNDDKVEYVTARFDEKGELITIKLLCAIYREGYYTDWNEDKATIFSKRAGRNITPTLANDVVNELVKRGFFERSIFNSFGILTSKGIQRRFLKAVSDRKDVEIVPDYWLLDIPGGTKQHPVLVNLPINSINPPDNSINPGINPQSKVKESKAEESKYPVGGSARARAFTPPSFDEVREYCEERKNEVDPERFVDHYTSNGWMVGKTKMKDWKASVRTWEKTNKGGAYGRHREHCGPSDREPGHEERDRPKLPGVRYC